MRSANNDKVVSAAKRKALIERIVDENTTFADFIKIENDLPVASETGSDIEQQVEENIEAINENNEGDDEGPPNHSHLLNVEQQLNMFDMLYHAIQMEGNNNVAESIKHYRN